MHYVRRLRRGYRRRHDLVLNFASAMPLCAPPRREEKHVSWMEANGISIHFELAGEGPSVVLLHEMGGTLASWDGIFPALSAQFRTLRYDQRGSGLSEKGRPAITPELL